jgi:hypothetical protein
VSSRLLNLLGAIIVWAGCVSAATQKPQVQPRTGSPSTSGESQTPSVPGQVESSGQDSAQEARRAAYPKTWEVTVPKDTKLDEFRKKLDKQLYLLPTSDLEDQTPIPIWFRVYLRKRFPNLEKSGPYQYPRTATRILQKMLDNPNDVIEGV